MYASQQYRYGVFIRFTLATGVRLGELLGLRWEDIDLENNLISVNRTVQRVNHTGTSEVIVGTPKSRSSSRMTLFSVRIIPLSL